MVICSILYVSPQGGMPVSLGILMSVGIVSTEKYSIITDESQLNVI